jgi:signal transduction histidine kinase
MTCYTRAELSLSGSDLSLLTTIADQAAVAIENARLSEQAQEVAVLEERQRLARELHDSVSQALYGIALGARTARTLLDRDPGRVVEPLEYVLAQAEAGLTEMRALIFELRPQALESEGLVAALRQQVEAIQVRHGVAAQVSLSAEPNVPFAVKEAMYRIAQEALHNTVKHARARSIELRLGGENGNITLEVRDDGKGFDTRGPFPGHLGLRSMRERALRLGGSLTVVSAPGEGTCIQVIVPSPARNGSRDG